MTKLGLYLSGDVWFFNQPLFHAFASWVLPYVSITTPMLRILRVIIRQRERLFYIVCNAWFHFSRKCDVLFLEGARKSRGSSCPCPEPMGVTISVPLVGVCMSPLSITVEPLATLLACSASFFTDTVENKGIIITWEWSFPQAQVSFLYIKKLYAKKEPESTLVSLYKMWEHNHRSLRFRLRANEENLPAGKC